MQANKTTYADEIIDLQSKIAYMEHTIDTLNDVIVVHAQEIKELKAKLALMYALLQKGQTDEIATFDLLADKPPHY